MVENQIDEEVVVIEGEALLPRLEEKAFAHFQEEALDLADDGGFEIGLRIAAAFIQAEELEHERFLEQVARTNNFVAFFREPANAFCVAAKREAFVQAGGELSFEFAHRPVLFSGFDLIEAALVGILDAEKDDVMRPA